MSNILNDFIKRTIFKEFSDYYFFFFTFEGVLGRGQIQEGFPGGSEGKGSACNAAVLGSIPELGRSPEEKNGNPLPYSCLENSIDRGAWWVTVHGIAKS